MLRLLSFLVVLQFVTMAIQWHLPGVARPQMVAFWQILFFLSPSPAFLHFQFCLRGKAGFCAVSHKQIPVPMLPAGHSYAALRCTPGRCLRAQHIKPVCKPRTPFAWQRLTASCTHALNCSINGSNFRSTFMLAVASPVGWKLLSQIPQIPRLIPGNPTCFSVVSVGLSVLLEPLFPVCK